MRLLAIFGSPRPGGFSSSMHELFLEEFAGAGYEIKKVFVYRENIQACLACGFCRRQSRCLLSDSMLYLYQDIRQAQMISISAPVYFSSLPGPLKNMIDRCQVLWEENSRGGGSEQKAGYFISAAGRDYPDIFLPSLKIVSHFYNSINCAYEKNDFYLLSNTDRMADIPAERGAELRSRGRDLLGLLSKKNRRD